MLAKLFFSEETDLCNSYYEHQLQLACMQSTSPSATFAQNSQNFMCTADVSLEGRGYS